MGTAVLRGAGGPHRSVSFVAAIALGAALLAPIAGAADKVKVKAQLTTAAALNPDYRGRPSPCVLIVFQLSAADAFQNADFFSLYDPKAAVLSGALLERNQLTLQPGEMRPLELEFSEDARYVGFVAAFRDVENAQWRALVELPKKGFFKSIFSRSKLVIALDALAVSAKIE
jgi:type VI secretion system protein VasD